MANKVTIDVEARFVDNVTNETKAATKSFENLEKAAEGAAKDIDAVGKAKPKVQVDSDSAAKKLDTLDKKLNKIGKSKTEAKLSILDKATAIIEKVTSKAKAFGNKSYSALVKIRDSNVLSSLNKMSNGLNSLTKKTWTTAIKIKDTFTAPLTKLKNSLFNIKTLIGGIASAWAAVQLVKNPINVADAYSSAKISFSTLLGESAGQQMMDDLDEFAKATPFNTTNVIDNAQKMLAMGWDAESIIKDMETIGNAAAATGKMDVGLESIVRALSQIKTKGRLSTEELNQLAEAGIAAKAMLAENLGYGTGDSGIAAMTEDLEKGAIASDVALQALMAGMQKYDGMMDSMANETVEGLWSQMQDAFSINIVRKWGQGLQDGAKRGFGSIVSLLDEAEAAMSEFGDTLYEVGETISNWAADKLENAIKRITKITGSFEFKNANLGEKISMLWNGVVVDPLKEWWENGGRDKTADTAGEIGSWIGKTLTDGLLAIFGMTDILDPDASEKLGEEGGMSIAQSFAKGFKDNFDGSAITDAIVDAIGDVWNALPTWAKILIGGYGVGKAAGLVSSAAGGITKFIGTAAAAGVGDTIVAGTGLRGLIGGNVVNAAGDVIGAAGLRGLIGSTGNAMVSGTGVLGKLASTGYGMVGGPASAGAYFGAGMSGGTAALIGALPYAGGIAAGASVIKGGIDLYDAHKAFKSGDEVEGQAKTASGMTTLGGVGVGAAIGSMILPGVGTLIGAGIGGIAGWIGGNAWADEIRKTDDAINDVTAATEDLETEEEKLAEQAKMVWQNMKDHFGDVKLSMSEIERIADQIVWGDDLATFEQFTTATQTAEASLKSLKSAAEATNKWMWKARLGVEFNEDEQESIIASFDEYVASAKSYVENKHYEFTAAVSLLVDVESEGGKGILESGNAFYGKMQEDLEVAGTELGDALTKALADGFINAEEQEAITAAQNKIAEITEKISAAEAAAELELIRVKFKGAKLDEESFALLMEQLGTTLDERITAIDEAYTVSLTNLNLQLAEGAITQDDYDKQLDTLTEGRIAKINEVKAEILGVELEVIEDAYEIEGVTSENLKNALESSLQDNIDPITWTPEQAREYLGLDGLSESSALALAEYLGGISDQLGPLEIETDVEAKIGEVTTDGSVEEKIDGAVPDVVEDTVQVNIATKKEVETVELLAEELNIPESIAASTILKLNATPTFMGQIDLLASQFGISNEYAEDILWKLTGEEEIQNKISVTGRDFGIPRNISETVWITITGRAAFRGGIFGTNNDDNAYRGGIFGSSSAMGSYARGGIAGDIPGYSDGGIVRGGSQLIEVAEEGSPEMVIPLSSQRRGRALKLWAQAGNIMGVPGFARGGIIGGNGTTDEGIRFRTYGTDDSAGGQNVQVDVGGITVEVNVNASNNENIAEAIKAQANEIAETVAGIMADALGGQFENTPVRGGAA